MTKKNDDKKNDRDDAINRNVAEHGPPSSTAIQVWGDVIKRLVDAQRVHNSRDVCRGFGVAVGVTIHPKGSLTPPERDSLWSGIELGLLLRGADNALAQSFAALMIEDSPKDDQHIDFVDVRPANHPQADAYPERPLPLFGKLPWSVSSRDVNLWEVNFGKFNVSIKSGAPECSWHIFYGSSLLSSGHSPTTDEAMASIEAAFERVQRTALEMLYALSGLV